MDTNEPPGESCVCTGVTTSRSLAFRKGRPMFQSQCKRNPLFLSALALTAAATTLLASLSLAAPADRKKPPSTDAKAAVKPAAPSTENDRIVHALERLG